MLMREVTIELKVRTRTVAFLWPVASVNNNGLKCGIHRNSLPSVPVRPSAASSDDSSSSGKLLSDHSNNDGMYPYPDTSDWKVEDRNPNCSFVVC